MRDDIKLYPDPVDVTINYVTKQEAEEPQDGEFWVIEANDDKERLVARYSVEFRVARWELPGDDDAKYADQFRPIRKVDLS